jgi:hypothetical protein
MKILTSLPPGDWTMIVFRGDLVFACPTHAPRLLDVQSGLLIELSPNGVFTVMEEEIEEDSSVPESLLVPGPETKQ